MRIFLLLLLLPFLSSAQEVKPIVAQDYLNLIRPDSASRFIDSTNDFTRSTLKLQTYYNQQPVGRVIIRNNHVILKNYAPLSLLISGQVNSSFALNSVTRLPQTQNEFVQGRSKNGNVIWRGPETNEVFSYGPAVQLLEFDGSNYAYDQYGNLVRTGYGNGKPAVAYNPSLFRTGNSFSQSALVQIRLMKTYQEKLKMHFRGGHTTENLVMKSNRNVEQFFENRAQFTAGKSILTATYNYKETKGSNTNRTGYANRIYQNYLLTPVSFNSKENISDNGVQKTYASIADNPFYLLTQPQGFSSWHHQAALNYENKVSNAINFQIAQNMEWLHQQSNETYPQGTAFFPNGGGAQRTVADKNYYLQPKLSWKTSGYYLKHQAELSFTLNSSKREITYLPGSIYDYKRTTAETNLAYSLEKNYNDNRLTVKAGNKTYHSNIGNATYFLLPYAFVSVEPGNRIKDKFNYSFSTSFVQYKNEASLRQSFATANLLTVATKEAFSIYPDREIKTYKGLQPASHTDWMAKTSIYSRSVKLEAIYAINRTKHDFVPTVNGNELQLANAADFRQNSIELKINHSIYHKKWTFSNYLSFYKYTTKVTGVADGFDFAPLAGYQDVHRSLVKGQPVGVITGSAYARNSQGQMIIDNDGFPLANAVPVAIGDPTPDFSMKLSHYLSLKNFTFNIDLEWRKGGDVWNGTQAALDYYGRSLTSAHERYTNGYVFEGVTIDGHPNTKPVKFYDASLPVEQNRWTRYGTSGIAEAYIQDGSFLRINYIGATQNFKLHRSQKLQLSLYVDNLLLWTKYKGVDPQQSLYGEPDAAGLDFFNLPSTKTFGCSLSFQF